ncbi:adenylyl cyclase X E isoform X2 [Drosophila mojavensis]|uniref:adenylyl cyclase X E isoform X2 n=1 Tax=Drosophila mojavensis TaxID=7230 RepID=UPI0013EE89EF|nr:adenylyl cyclase X E isoform X2 [Drosophila mojavensis]
MSSSIKSPNLMLMPDESIIDVSKLKGWEWINLRKQIEDLSLEPCYRRYVERLAVVNVSLFVFLAELLGFIHVLLQIMYKGFTIRTTAPFIFIMVLLPLIVLICFKDKKKYARFRLWNILASCAAALMIVLTDTFFMALSVGPDVHLRSSYDHVVTISIYFLLPISVYGKPSFLGFGSTAIYFLYYVYSSLSIREPISLSSHGSYAIYLVSLNVFMEGFRIFIEYDLRRMILNRRKLLYQNIKLRSAVLMENDIMEQLLSSNIRSTLKAEMYKHIDEQRQGMRYFTSTLLFIELYSNVSILIGNITNYQLITQLDVSEILEILNGICVRLDQSAAKHNVLPIKFLGNFLSCISGIIPKSTRRTNACVDFALDFISIVDEIRQEKELKIAVRVAVHDGEAFTAIVGRQKCCFDIWSQDVAIAHCMASLGRKNMVHVSQKTLRLLHSEYNYENGPEEAQSHSLLQKANITTYLIGPQPRVIKSTTGNFFMRISKDSESNSDSLPYHSMLRSSFYSVSRASVAFDGKDLDALRQKTASCLLEKVEFMPVDSINLARFFDFSDRIERGNEDYVIKHYITPFWRIYRKPEIESGYNGQPDLLFKYALLLMVFIATVFCIMALFPPFSSVISYKMLYMYAILIIICLLAFYNKITIQISKHRAVSPPKFFLHRWLCTFSRWLEEKRILRSIVYVLCLWMVYILGTLEAIMLRREELKLIEYKTLSSPSIVEPWEASEHMILVFMLFTFLSVPLIFKASLIVLLCIIHILTLYVFYNIKHSKQKTNMGLPAEVASVWHLLSACLYYMILDHHIIYLKRVSYYFLLNANKKRELIEKSKSNAEHILANMLPTYLVPIFINHPSNDLPYHKYVAKVAVLFASIVNFPLDTTSLRVLNEFICYFDDLIEEYAKGFKVEKIKVINWTYVAACGLDAGDNLSQSSWTSIKKPVRGRLSRVSNVSSEHIQIPELLNYNPRFNHPHLEYSDYCVLYLVHYAADMLRIMQDVSMQNLTMKFPNAMPGQLKIGISHGPAHTGVVGQSRFYFDLWGRTVNWASIMAEKGVTGHIHVTENTARTLSHLDIKCYYRGLEDNPIEGRTSTYLVDLNDELNFQGVDEASWLQFPNDERLAKPTSHNTVKYDRRSDDNNDGKDKSQ